MAIKTNRNFLGKYFLAKHRVYSISQNRQTAWGFSMHQFKLNKPSFLYRTTRGRQATIRPLINRDGEIIIEPKYSVLERIIDNDALDKMLKLK